MRTAIWLYLFMFVAFFDLHAQYPILSPFALSLGAAPSFIGLIMGVYSHYTLAWQSNRWLWCGQIRQQNLYRL